MRPTPPIDNSQIFEEASAWFVEFRTPARNDATRLEFHDWLKRSPEHIRAYLEIAATYAQIPTPEGQLVPAELIAKAKAAADCNVFPLAPLSVASRQPARSKRTFVPLVTLATAASVALLAMGGWLLTQRNIYETVIGEQRSLTLDDGSIVELNARSRIHVSFDAARRCIELQSGQALFRVAKDRDRPFTVSSGSAIVRAIGTEFDVYRKNSGTTITVIEGRVAVRHEEPTPRDAAASLRNEKATNGANAAKSDSRGVDEISLAAGEQMTVTPKVAHKTRAPNILAATAWTQHQLLFDATPLSEVAEEFNRYNRRSIVIDTPELRSLMISGQYTSTSTASLVRFLSLQAGIKVIEMDTSIHIARE